MNEDQGYVYDEHNPEGGYAHRYSEPTKEEAASQRVKNFHVQAAHPSAQGGHTEVILDLSNRDPGDETD